jgi:hypothetical protein
MIVIPSYWGNFLIADTVSLVVDVSLLAVRVSPSCCSRLPVLPLRSAPGLRREEHRAGGIAS